MRACTKTQRRLFSVLSSLCLCSSTSVLGACGDGGSDGGGSGTLIVPFQLGNKRSCDDLGVKLVRAELNDMAYVNEAPCTAGQVRFVGIPPGTYTIQMFGVDNNGVEIMDNYTSGDAVVDVTGNDMSTFTKNPVMLTAAPAHLWVRWDFGFSSCNGVGIVSFDISAWSGAGGTLLVSQNIRCLEEGEGAEQYREILDPDRRISGDESGEVSVQPLDKNDELFGATEIFKYKAPGAGQDIKLTLDCGTGFCTSTGRPD